METLVKYLSADGRVEPYFAYNEGGLLVERLEAMGVPTRQITLSSRFDFRAARELAGLCGEWGIELIHCHYLRENYIAMLAKRYNRKIRVVYTNHFVLANDAVTRLSNRWLDKRQDQMIAVCNKGKEQLMANGWSGGHIQVIFNAVDPDAWAGEQVGIHPAGGTGYSGRPLRDALCLPLCRRQRPRLSDPLPEAACRAV